MNVNYQDLVDHEFYHIYRTHIYILLLYLFISGLSFGRVDEYGRFERNIEPDPDKNKGIVVCNCV